MSLFSKEAECDLCPDATRRPPGLLWGSSALPPAAHLDGQSDRGIRQRHVPVGETEATVPKWPTEWELLHRGESLNLCPTPLSQHRGDTWTKPKLLFLSAFSSGAAHHPPSLPHSSRPSPPFTVTLQYVKEQKLLTAFMLVFPMRELWLQTRTTLFLYMYSTMILGSWRCWPNTERANVELALKGKWEHHFRVVQRKARAHKKPLITAKQDCCLSPPRLCSLVCCLNQHSIFVVCVCV